MEELYKFQIKMYDELIWIYNTFKWLGVILASIVLQNLAFYFILYYHIDQVGTEVKDLQGKVELLKNSSFLVDSNQFKRISDLEEWIKTLEGSK